MSFRSRLLAFFAILVVVPVAALGAVLLPVTADTETARGDARVAQGLRTAFALYDESRAAARPAVRALAADRALEGALAGERPDQVARRLAAVLRDRPEVRSIEFVGRRGRPLARVGRSDGVAALALAPALANGRRLGTLSVSATTAGDYARRLRRLTGLEIRVASGGRELASTAGPVRAAPGAELEAGGRRLRGRMATLPETARPDVRVGAYEPSAAVAGSLTRRRLVLGAILAVLLLAALAAAVLIVRGLGAQVREFRGAARRLREGNTERPVRVFGHDEFAELGREFNLMGEQLAGKVREVEAKGRELDDSVRRVGEAFASGLDRESIVNLAVRTAVDACGAEAGRLVPAETGQLETAATGHADGELEGALRAAERRTLRSGPIADGVARTAGGRAPTGGRPSRASLDGVHALAAPLNATRTPQGESRVMGALSIARHTEPFSDAELGLFAYLADQAAVSIENVDRHERATQQAVTDGLTGLANVRRFDEVLSGELERVSRAGGHVGLVMLDLDDFKEVNDTHGHQQGDAVLVEVARTLRRLAREIDEPARIGGEEMAVILPQTDLAGCERAAARMHAAIAEMAVPRLGGGPPLRVSASFGVAALPELAVDGATLVAAADAALYRAKRSGKNRVASARREPAGR